jgi:hypothetical protein
MQPKSISLGTWDTDIIVTSQYYFGTLGNLHTAIKRKYLSIPMSGIMLYDKAHPHMQGVEHSHTVWNYHCVTSMCLSPSSIWHLESFGRFKSVHGWIDFIEQLLLNRKE